MGIRPNGELIPVGGGDTIPLVREVLSIGRRESCDICLHFPNISGVHCQLYFQEGFWRVRDQNSTNGVKVNGVRVQEKLLHPDDELCIAKRRFIIRYELPGSRRALDEIEEDIFGQSLLEKAGLERPKRREDQRRSSKKFDAADFLLTDDDEN